MKKNMKQSFVLITTLFTIFFVTLLLGGFSYFSSQTISKDFHKDLATLRGYWATYGAKELNIGIDDNITFQYWQIKNITIDGFASDWDAPANAQFRAYEINVTRESDSNNEAIYTWFVNQDGNMDNNTTLEGGLFYQTLRVKDTNSSLIHSFLFEGRE
jgi:hypothetical protein